MQRNTRRAPAQPKKQGTHQVRIIGGQWKRTPLPVLDAEGLRPTPDRVRETLFNWLNHLFDGGWSKVNCLDLFAGTGALGFEAASRGAHAVTMVEDNSGAVHQLNAIKSKLNAGQVSILRGDALATAQSLASRNDAVSRFQLIFLDPPYHCDWLAKILPLCNQLLADGGLVYAEAEIPLDAEGRPDWMNGWEVVRSDKAGMVFFHLLRRNSMLENQA